MVRVYDPKYGYTPILVSGGFVALCAILGVACLVHGFRNRHELASNRNRFDWYLGTLLTGAGLLVWPSILVLYDDPTNGVAILAGALATILYGWAMRGRAWRRDHFPWGGA